MKNELGLKIIKSFSLDKKLLRLLGQQKIARELRVLHGGISTETQLYKIYLAKKIEKIFYSFVAILVLFFVLWINPLNEKELIENSIARNGYEGIEKSVHLIARSEGVEEEIELLVEPLHYSKLQLDQLATELFNNVPRDFFSYEKVTGEGVYIIKKHLKLPTKIEGYPFELSFESSDYEVMDNQGHITVGDLQSPKEVTMTLTLSCYEYTWKREYLMSIYEPEADWKTGFSEKLVDVIEELDYTSAESEKLLLPNSINGHSISYEEKSDGTVFIIGGLLIIVLVSLWFLPDNNLSVKISERNRQLLTDYAMLVNKLTLYMGAGLSLRSSVAKIAQNADKNRFFAKELEVAVRELENGISEQMVMERLAERCRIPCYIKLSVLLTQNIRKGNNSLQKQLKDEVIKAFEERKILAGKYAQEAGTKLLFPMVMMLLVVMVMIMYPAFVSFTI